MWVGQGGGVATLTKQAESSAKPPVSLPAATRPGAIRPAPHPPSASASPSPEPRRQGRGGASRHRTEEGAAQGGPEDHDVAPVRCVRRSSGGGRWGEGEGGAAVERPPRAAPGLALRSAPGAGTSAPRGPRPRGGPRGARPQTLRALARAPEVAPPAPPRPAPQPRRRSTCISSAAARPRVTTSWTSRARSSTTSRSTPAATACSRACRRA
jgi:hypothetical protein